MPKFNQGDKVCCKLPFCHGEVRGHFLDLDEDTSYVILVDGKVLLHAKEAILLPAKVIAYVSSKY